MKNLRILSCVCLLMALLFGCATGNSTANTASKPGITEPKPTVNKDPTVIVPPSDPPIVPPPVITLTTPEAVNLPSKWCPVDGAINFRSGASYSSSLLGQIPGGAEFTLLGWDHEYAKVEYNGRTGYVSVAYIRPANQSGLESWLPVVEATDTYTYQQMVQDISTLTVAYPDILKASTIGKSENGTDIPLLILGDENAKYHVLITGATHAREHMTTWLLMAMIDHWCGRGTDSYKDVCFHIVPMLNPDGVAISQSGTLPEELVAVYQRDLANGYTTLSITEYARSWKANGKGVDINRSYDAGWEQTSTRPSPSSERYKGTQPFDCQEARLIRDYTLSRNFDITISYHSSGSIHYYEYGSKNDVIAASLSLGNTIGKVNGYPCIGSSGLDAAGYKDWAMEVLGIPSLTIEIGVGTSPLPLREAYSIFARNAGTIPAIAQWLKNQ